MKNLFQEFKNLKVYHITDRILTFDEQNYDIQISYDGKLAITDPMFFTRWNMVDGLFQAIVTYMHRSNDILSIRFPDKNHLHQIMDLKYRDRYLNSAEGIAMPYHTNSHIELCYVVEGELKLKIENKIEILKEHHAILLDLHTLHCEFINYKEAKVVFLGITLEMFRMIAMTMNLSSKFKRFLTVASIGKKSQGDYLTLDLSNQCHEFESFLLKYYTELDQKNEGYELILEGFAKRITKFINQSEYNHECCESHRQKEIIFDEIQRYLFVHHVDARLSDMSVCLGYTEDYLNRIIKEITGATYSDLLKEIRVQLAITKLKETDMSIHDIVSSVGYSNVQFFYQVFKDKFGMTPNEYRKKHHLSLTSV